MNEILQIKKKKNVKKKKWKEKKNEKMKRNVKEKFCRWMKFYKKFFMIATFQYIPEKNRSINAFK